MMLNRFVCFAFVVTSFFGRSTLLAQVPDVFAGGATAESSQESLTPTAATASSQPASALQTRIEALVKEHQGDVAVSVRHLATGESFEINGKRPQATASLIKLPIMVELYKQAVENKTALYKQLDLRSDDMVPGSGILTTHFSPGARFSIRDAVRLMIAVSDNTATNMIVDKVGINSINQHMQQLGYKETRLNSKVYRRDTSVDAARSERYGLGSTTADDMVDLLAKIQAGTVVSPSACKDMLEHLAACEDKQKFPALLPAGTKVWHKTGSVDAVRTDAGIIQCSTGQFALCVLTENNADKSWTADNAGDRLCAQIALAAFEYFDGKNLTKQPSDNQPAQTPTEPKLLAKGATGEMVEALQRTINLQVETANKLSVDGDFGPATEAAVKLFQSSQGLEPTGQVDAATWKALGPLQLDDQPVDEPQIVNAQQLDKSPADDPYATPAVTCKAWAIADSQSGEVMWGHDNDQSLDIASTTKIMTAYLVMQYCQQFPAALDEQLTFSARADATLGSTAGVRAGEKLRVVELLYGLMLPSGNDASVALAEHFGARVFEHLQNTTVEAVQNPVTSIVESDDSNLPPPVVNPELEPLNQTAQPAVALETPDRQWSAEENYAAFIQSMNLMASRLGMTQTHYENPHGLTAQAHKSSCGDLVKLTIAARQLALFKQVTTTRQYGCQVTSSEGYVRNLKWENTNQLLPIEGYAGVKTGTTDAAGACLVSVGSYRGRELVIVVLGSAASASRYADTRNLFAYAWRELFK